MIATVAAMTRPNMIMLAVSLVLFACLVQTSSARSLLQGFTCSGAIPQCEPNRCYLQTVAGKMQNVCERCMPGYNTTQDGLNCVCKPGFWHSCTGVCSCLACDKGMFCPGGWPQAKNYAADILKGERLSCEKAVPVPATGSSITTSTIQANGLTTKSTRSSRPQDCVPMPGFYLNATSRALQQAALCPRNTYSPGYGRIRQCLRCQSGTEENSATGFSDDLTSVKAGTKHPRTNRTSVCQVPPGRYLVQNVVRDCPAGSFRTSYSETTESSSRYCYTCPPGVTTNGTKAVKKEDCNVVVAGVLLNYTDLQSAQIQAAAGDNSLSDNAVSLCPYGTYFPGGVLDSTKPSTCLLCPYGTTTQFMGSTSINDCQIPPGYYVKITSTGNTLAGAMEKCPTNSSGQGFYRSGWTSYTDAKAQGGSGTAACTPCGPGIVSALTDIDESLGGNITTNLVAGSSFSCYINAGWGMVPTGSVRPDNTMEFTAVLCDSNTYGVANITYGLQSTPCKPCQRNLITLQAGSNNYTQCVNPAGFGYSPNGATRCPPGTYAPEGSMQGCVQCPAGRTTDDDPAKQKSINDCYVVPGYGVFVGSATDPWNPTTSGMDDPTKVALPVLPCPAGYWGDGMELDSKCETCAAGKTTAGEGSTSAAACDKCAAGYGDSGKGCTKCAAGTYQPGYLGSSQTTGEITFGSGSVCISCPDTRSVYISSKGNETELISGPTSYRTGAMSRDECVPKTAQLGIDVGTRIFDDPTLLTSVTTDKAPNSPELCMAKCADNSCCFVQYDYAYMKAAGAQGTKECWVLNLTPNSDANTLIASKLLFYKMLPSDAIAAASLTKAADDVKSKAMSSGLYARCELPTAGGSGVPKGWSTANAISKVGKSLGITLDASPASNLALCKKKCDMMSTCWGFIVQADDSKVLKCDLRGGYDELDVRSFFRNPDPSTGFNW